MKYLLLEKAEWNGTLYINEIYEFQGEINLFPITQVQAVCFDENGKVVLYKHIDGYFGLPGGKVEEGEDLVVALKREIYEETACELLECDVIAYIKSYKEKSPEKVTYNLRYFAKVKKHDEPVQDPAGKALERILVNLDEASGKLNWGEKGRILIELARERFKQA